MSQGMYAEALNHPGKGSQRMIRFSGNRVKQPKQNRQQRPRAPTQVALNQSTAVDAKSLSAGSAKQGFVRRAWSWTRKAIKTMAHSGSDFFVALDTLLPELGRRGLLARKGTANVTVVPAGTILVDLKLRPSSFGPRSRATASLYDRYLPKRINLRYQAATSAMRDGSLMGVIDYDPSSNWGSMDPQARLQVAATHPSWGQTPVFQNFVWQWRQDMTDKEEFYTHLNNSTTPTDAEVRQACCGRFYLMTATDLTEETFGALGNIFIDYDMNYSRPQSDAPNQLATMMPPNNWAGGTSDEYIFATGTAGGSHVGVFGSLASDNPSPRMSFDPNFSKWMGPVPDGMGFGTMATEYGTYPSIVVPPHSSGVILGLVSTHDAKIGSWGIGDIYTDDGVTLQEGHQGSNAGHFTFGLEYHNTGNESGNIALLYDLASTGTILGALTFMFSVSPVTTPLSAGSVDCNRDEKKLEGAPQSFRWLGSGPCPRVIAGSEARARRLASIRTSGTSSLSAALAGANEAQFGSPLSSYVEVPKPAMARQDSVTFRR